MKEQRKKKSWVKGAHKGKMEGRKEGRKEGIMFIVSSTISILHPFYKFIKAYESDNSAD
jgi:predicted transposase YdaD